MVKEVASLPHSSLLIATRKTHIPYAYADNPGNTHVPIHPVLELEFRSIGLDFDVFQPGESPAAARLVARLVFSNQNPQLLLLHC